MSAESTHIRGQAEAHLRALVGRADAVLREDQWQAIEALALDKRRALVVQRTGWGKSAVYFVATLLLRAGGAGPTVIVSPLLALMRNQIIAAERAGIRAVTINSTNIDDWDRIHTQVAAGEVDVLLVSPERLNNPGFRDAVLPQLAATAGLVVIDEAHCISDWGHDFRPDYRRIKTLLAELRPGIPVLATTATANERVTADVAEQLGADVLIQRGVLDRASLRLGVVSLKTADQRLAWLAEHLNDFVGSGIIYCLTVAATHEISDFLRGQGHQVAAYSGQTETTEREALESDLTAGRVKALVATSALGMGFDATLGFVINVGAPQSPVAYYQQVGRAGRGTDHAVVVLLPAREDRDIWKYFASLGFPPEGQVRQTLQVLSEVNRPVSTAVLETYVELGRSRLEAMLKVLDVDGAVRRVAGGWQSTGVAWAYDADRYLRVAEARHVEQQAMLDYIATSECRMRFLREQLDDPGLPGEAAVCGRCDNCGGLSLATAISGDNSDRASEHLSRPGVTVEPRKVWPTGLANLNLPYAGKITEGADVGRVVARLTDLGLGQQLRDLFRADNPDGEVPLPLIHGVIKVLQSWQPPVTGIVAIESRRRPLLVSSLADGLARYLQIPVLGWVRIQDDSIAPDQGSMNSAHRIKAIERRLALPLPTAQVSGQEILLVDDLIGTGWTMTMAAHSLRASGAIGVHPLALGTVS